jgi:hypothetical protein
LKKSPNIDNANALNHLLSKPVIENATKNKTQELELNLVAPDSTEEISNIEQNFSCSTISNSNNNELRNNIFNIQKVKKRNSLSEAATPQQYKCVKRFRSKSSDLSTNKKDSNNILSIKLTLIRDKSNQKNWINLDNVKTNATNLEENAIDSVNVIRNEHINQTTENRITPVQSVYNSTMKIDSTEVPELEENNEFENRCIVKNINNFENCLSPYLKNLVKKRNSSLRDVIHVDSDCNNLCKRRKFSDYPTIDKTQENINNPTDLVQSSSENNLQVKESLSLNKLSNNYSKKLLPKMDPCILNNNFLDNNENNQTVCTIQNVHASNNTTLSLSLPLNKILSTSLSTSNANEFLNSSKSSCSTSRNTDGDLTNENYCDHNSDSSLKVMDPEIEANSLKESDGNIEVDHNSNIEDLKKRDNYIHTIAEASLDNEISQDNLLENEELLINKNCQHAISDSQQQKTDLEIGNKASTQISLENETTIENLELELLKKNELNMNSEENNLKLQSTEFCKNNKTELNKAEENIVINSTIDVEVHKSKENMTEADNIHINTVSPKESLKNANSDNKDLESHDKNMSNISLNLNINKECKELDFCVDDKVTSAIENLLKSNIKPLENGKAIVNVKKIDTNPNKKTSVIEIATKETGDRSSTNSPDSQEMCIINIADSPLNGDQILPDSTGLDEHLEGGDFDFLQSIQKIKHNLDSDDDYNVDSDCDVEINDHESIEYSINMENTEENINLDNKITIASDASKTDEYQKSKKLIKTVHLQEPIKSSNAHCLKKLPNFYNECITKVVNKKSKIDDITNIDISDLNLYISDDIDDSITVLEHTRSKFYSKHEINKIQHIKMKSDVSITLDDNNQEIHNLTNITLNEKEKEKLTNNNKQPVGETFPSSKADKLEKEKPQSMEIEEMIISLCKQYDEQYILNNTVKDNSILLNELVSSSSESCKNQIIMTSGKSTNVNKNMSSVFTSMTNKAVVQDNINLETNLSILNDSSIASIGELVSTKNSKSQSTIEDQLSEKKRKMLNNEVSKGNSNSTFNNTNIVTEISNTDILIEDSATDKSKDNVSNVHQNNNLLSTSNKCLKRDSNEKLINKAYTLSTGSSIKKLENQVSMIKTIQSTDNVSSPIIFEVSVPSIRTPTENGYDLLKNININLVDEIDEIRDISVISSSASNVTEKPFKLRDINELLKKPEKLSSPKKTSENKISADTFIASQMPLLDTHSSNTRLLSEFICDVDKNNVPTSNYSDKFVALNNLINNINPTSHYSQLQAIYGKTDQSILNPKITNMAGPIPVTKNISNYSIQESYQPTFNVLPCCSYTVPRSNIPQALEKISQNDCTRSNHNTQSTALHAPSNMNGVNRKVVLASSIYSNFYAQDNVFTLDMPPLETLAILIPYIVKMHESSDSINKKIIEYKKMLLNKLICELKALDKIALHKRKKYINALLNFNTLTENTWKFQLIIITIIQCIFSLTNLTTKGNYHKVIQAIVNSINPEPTKQILHTLNSILKLYYHFKQKGINCGYSDRRQPLLLELESMSNKYQSNTVNTVMTDLQKKEFMTQAKIYYKISQIHSLQLQVPISDHNFSHEYQKVDEIIGTSQIPSQQNNTIEHNSRTEMINRYEIINLQISLHNTIRKMFK